MAVLLRDIIANGLCVVDVKRSESESESESKILPQYQNSLIRSFCPCGNLVGECLPQTLLCGLRRLSPPRSCGKKGGHDHAKKIQHTPPQPRCENPAAIDVHHASPMMKTIAKLRDKYDLKMTAERYTPDNTMPKTDEKFIRK